MAIPDLMALARRLARRSRARVRWRAGFAWSAALAGLALLAATVHHAWWPGGPWAAAGSALLIVWLAGLGALWRRARADARRLLLRADRQVGGEEQLSTAYELALDSPEHPFLPLLLKRCEALARRVDAARLLPMELSRTGIAALIFASAALVLYLVPADWLRTSRAALSLTQPFVAEEGGRIRQFAERLERMAERENMELVKALAQEAEVVGKALVNEPLDALDAAKRVEGLVNLANELSKKESDAHESFRGEQYVGFEDPNKQAGDQPPASGPATGYAGGSPITSLRTPEPGGNFSGQDQAPNESNMTKMDAPAENPPQQPKEPGDKSPDQPEQSVELQMIERARTHLQQSVKNLAQRPQLGDNRQIDASNEERLTDVKNQSTPEMGAQGQEKSGPGENTNRADGSSSSPSDEFGQGASQATAEHRPGEGEPEKHEFQDTQIEGADSISETEEKWVRQLPQLNAREIRPDGSVPIFQQRTVNAQGGSSIPRVYRAVVRSYFMHLERLNVQKARGEPLSTDLGPAGELSRSAEAPGGLRESLPSQSVRRPFERTGPPKPSSTR